MSRRPSEGTPVQERPEPAPGGATTEASIGTNPFPGPRPFVENEGWLFFGRDRELADLGALLFAQRALLLHGPSGGGKSSLVHAGLIPHARDRGFDFLPVARVRDTTLDPEEEVAGNRYLHNVIENWRDAGLAVPQGAITLAEVVRGLPPAEEPGRVVVFDQFEEIFVVHPESWKDRADLLLQVQAALDADPFLHVVFVLRDDYLARLQPLTPVLRDRLSTRYHLRGLSSAQALDAVVRPFATTGRSFAPGVAEALVKAIRAQPAVAPETRSYEGEDIEPVQLQIVSRTFFERLPRDVAEIGASDVERHADVGQALVGFYEQALAATVKSHRRTSERTVRLWFERQLVTPARTRGIVFRDKRTTAGLANEIVDDLEQRRVVRSEPRGPATWYELPHDRLVDAVLTSNRVWFASRSRVIARLSAVLGVLGVLTAVVSLVLLNVGGSDESSAPDPEHYEISTPGQPVRLPPISGRAGQLVTAVMAPDGFAGELRLLDDRGSVVGQATGSRSTPVVLTLRIPVDGQYELEARGQGRSEGSFHLAYAVQTVDAGGARLTPGQPVPGDIGTPDEVDVYTFAGRPGAVAQVTMAADGDMATALVITGTGAAIADRGRGYVALTFVVPDEGTYEVHASSFDKETGPYRLDLEFPEVGGAPGRVTGTLDGRNRVDVRAIRSDTGGILEASFAPQAPGDLTLFTADGLLLAEAYIGEDESEGGFGPWPIAPATTYLVMVEWNQDSPTPYRLSVNVEDASPLIDGRAEGELSRPQQLVAYRLDAQAGDVNLLVSPEGNLDLAVGLVQPDGTELILQDDAAAGGDELFSARLRQSGPHLIVIGSNSADQTGRFNVAVTGGG